MFKTTNSVLKKVINIRNLPVRLNCRTTEENLLTLNRDLAKRLETVSLVGFSERSGFEVLRASVEFADSITHIDTKEVDPLITVLENWSTPLREDLATDKTTRKSILGNASVVEEDYFVAPNNQSSLDQD